MLSAPMSIHGKTAEGYLTKEDIMFYGQLAKGGVAAVCLGETLVHSASGNNHGRVFRLMIPAVCRALSDALIQSTAMMRWLPWNWFILGDVPILSTMQIIRSTAPAPEPVITETAFMKLPN